MYNIRMEYLLSQIFNELLAVVCLVSMSIGIRILMQFFGQQWVTTTAHTATLVFLPIITFTITNVISGNIALSLGMVGALSIVRFRNPVRSPLELSVYFGAVTMGIAASVSLAWLFFFGFAIAFGAIILVFSHFFSKALFGKDFFQSSFAEGNSLSTLELTASDNIDFLDESEFLKMKQFSEGKVSYVIASSQLDELKNILSRLEGNNFVQNYQLNQ